MGGRTAQKSVCVVIHDKHEKKHIAYKLIPGTPVTAKVIAEGAGKHETIGIVKDKTKDKYTEPVTPCNFYEWPKKWAGRRSITTMMFERE